MKFYPLLCCMLLLSLVSLYAQNPYDECGSAFRLENVLDYCSELGEFNNQNTGDSQFSASTCFSGNSNDVWFEFIALATDVTIIINGDASGINGGTLKRPEIAFYRGDCTVLNERACSDNNSGDIVELYKGGLILGQLYRFRVRGGRNSVGTFQICIKNYFTPAEPDSDCISGSLLCDKSSFTIQSVVGAGNDNDEAPNSCLGTSGPSESNSTWFKWTAKNTGSLTFILTPNNPNDDLDFAIYELSNGISNCNGKVLVKCMAAGELREPTSPCMGATGLRENASGDIENPGCGGGNDNWLSPLQMIEGRSYGLLINNFTSTGNGFSIEFGGTGEFQGPEADFRTSTDEICGGQPVVFTDNSSGGVSNIVSWLWSFGVGADISSAKSRGPHTVIFDSPGEKTIALVVENDLGCRITTVQTIIVNPCCETDNKITAIADIEDVECSEDMDGRIDVMASTNFPPLAFLWQDSTTNAELTNIGQGNYQVTISDQFCEEVLNYTVDGPPKTEIDTILRLATCEGGQDGEIELNVSGGTPPYEFIWYDGQVMQPNNIRRGLAIGMYEVTVQDANNCQIPMELEVKELELILDPTVEAKTNPSCFGFNDGSIVLNIDNGLPPYEFDWNDGQGFQDESSLFSIASGSFEIDVRDANGCFGHFTFEVEPPPPLEISTDSVDVSCFGEADGIATAIVVGGTGDYSFTWSDPDAQTTPSAFNLLAGIYTVTVNDENDCEIIGQIEVVQPPEIQVVEILKEDVICFGDETGTLDIIAEGGVPPFQYSLNNKNYQEETSFTNLSAALYYVYVKDAFDCIAIDSIEIIEPNQLIVNVETDTIIDLGQSFQISTNIFPSGRPVEYQWSDSLSLDCTTCPNPNAMPIDNTIYTVTVTDETNCIARDSIQVRVNKIRPIFIPNAFTPNADGNNDLFTIFGGSAVREIKSIRIFDRWGTLIYEGNNLPKNDDSQGWDGTYRGESMSSAVFAYVIEVVYIDNEVVQFEGDVTILR